MDFYKTKIEAMNFISDSLQNGVPEEVIVYKLAMRYGFERTFFDKFIKKFEAMKNSQKSDENDRKY